VSIYNTILLETFHKQWAR